MKYLVLVFALFANSVLAHSLKGSWQLVSGFYVDEQGQTIDYEGLKLSAIKVVSDNHFSFITMADGKFWAAGAGDFEATDSTYAERPVHTSYPVPADGQFRFDYVLDGDLWQKKRWQDGKLVEQEVWRRMP
ncbi:hypothetical protein GCM10009092_44330 [Bowmanella denitrificans]|uniref:Uncharacterized protein n=1 Tax=Bowmanella denitrificans TaxID=366582 RepID=A0ABN0XX44_9ALTE|nr:hypothetical protein [Bowmanella denitrificans]